MEPIPKIVPRFEETQQDTRPRREFQDHIERSESGFRRMRSLAERFESDFLVVYALGAIVILLALGFIGLSWYAHRSIGNDSLALAKIPVLQKSADAMGDRLGSIEGKMNGWTSDRKAFSETMAKMEQTIGSNIQSARDQVQAAANQVGQRLRDEINKNLQRLQNRVENVEATQRESHDELAAAQNEIGSLRKEIAGLQKQNEERLNELQQSQSNAQDNVTRLNGKIGAIDNQVTAHTGSLNTLNEQIERDPAMFELSNNKTQQVAPGIYVTIKHTDVTHQKVDGWMQLADEGRIVPIRNLGALQPLPFLTRSDDRSYELVFTGVKKNGATGYVLVPHSNQPASSAN
jgi:predicted  nucleic acid-binding Zn-ribbon protein